MRGKRNWRRVPLRSTFNTLGEGRAIVGAAATRMGRRARFVAVAITRCGESGMTKAFARSAAWRELIDAAST